MLRDSTFNSILHSRLSDFKMAMLERFRYIMRVATGTAADETVSSLSSKVFSAALARLYLRRCTRVGLFTRVYGRPRVVNQGRLIIGDRVRIWSTTARTEFAVFTGGTLEIGDRCFINYGTSIAATGLVRIGQDCMLGAHSMILDNDFHEIECRDVRPAPRPVVLGNNVWLGNRALILPGVTIGHDAVVGAGAVVVKDIPPRSVAVGNPARIVRTF